MLKKQMTNCVKVGIIFGAMILLGGFKISPVYATVLPDGSYIPADESTPIYDSEGYDAEGYNWLGFDREGYNREGYNASGFNRQGYDRNGFDAQGYDKDGYNQYGRDREGFDRAGLNEAGLTRAHYAGGHNPTRTNALVASIIANIEFNPWAIVTENAYGGVYDEENVPYNKKRGENQITEEYVGQVVDSDGICIDPSHYSLTVEKLSVNKYGYGTYQIKVTGDICYQNSQLVKTVRVVPYIHVSTIVDEISSDGYGLKNARYFIAEKDFKGSHVEGVEYKIGELKIANKKTGKNKRTITIYNNKFDKNTKKGKLKFKNAKKQKIKNSNWGDSGYLLATFPKMSRLRPEGIWTRYYVTVDGKKFYSNWSKITGDGDFINIMRNVYGEYGDGDTIKYVMK